MNKKIIGVILVAIIAIVAIVAVSSSLSGMQEEQESSQLTDGQKAFVADDDKMEKVRDKPFDYNNDGVIDEKDENKTIIDAINEKHPQYDFNGNKHEL